METDNTDLWLAENEVCSNDGFVYQKNSKPTESFISIRKEISKRQKTEEVFEISQENLISEIIALTKSRGKNRILKLNETSNKFLEIMKKLNKQNFDLKDLREFLSEARLPLATQKRVQKEIINFLIADNKIEATERIKRIHYLEQKEIGCYDFESFTALMNSNGFRFKEAADETETWFDTIIGRYRVKDDSKVFKWVGRGNQKGCPSNGSNSVIMRTKPYFAKGFRII